MHTIALLAILGILSYSTHALNDRSMVEELEYDTLAMQAQEVRCFNFSLMERKNSWRTWKMKKLLITKNTNWMILLH